MRLLMCAPAPVSDSGGQIKLDTKFVEGMFTHVRDWGGPITCILWRTEQDIPFGKVYPRSELPFELIVLDKNDPLPDSILEGVSVAMLSADLPDIGLLARQIRHARLPFVVAIEYTLATRLRILWLEGRSKPLRLLRSAIWLLSHEREARNAMRHADGVQFNGFPARDCYSTLNLNNLLYLDNRMSPELFISASELADKEARLRQGAPLRLIHSGRLEYLKGSQDLPQLMGLLRAKGINATLDVYGTGSLSKKLRAEFAPYEESTRMHEPVDFETQLVPINRTKADIFISCHRQQDPSCSYLEAMGCGLAVAGYANQMWSGLQGVSRAGGVAPLADVPALAEIIVKWDKDREALISSCSDGLEFARQHSFPREFARRMKHIRGIAKPVSRC